MQSEPIPDWQKSRSIDNIKQTIFAIRSGAAVFTNPPRPLPKGQFMTNAEDALIAIKDIKFNTYVKSEIPQIQAKAKQWGYENVAKNLTFLSNENI